MPNWRKGTRCWASMAGRSRLASRTTRPSLPSSRPRVSARAPLGTGMCKYIILNITLNMTTISCFVPNISFCTVHFVLYRTLCFVLRCTMLYYFVPCFTLQSCTFLILVVYCFCSHQWNFISFISFTWICYFILNRQDKWLGGLTWFGLNFLHMDFRVNNYKN